nr:MAG TPA: hypothetical protein [Caudoviricetes sp.]
MIVSNHSLSQVLNFAHAKAPCRKRWGAFSNVVY